MMETKVRFNTFALHPCNTFKRSGSVCTEERPETRVAPSFITYSLKSLSSWSVLTSVPCRSDTEMKRTSSGTTAPSEVFFVFNNDSDTAAGVSPAEISVSPSCVKQECNGTMPIFASLALLLESHLSRTPQTMPRALALSLGEHQCLYHVKRFFLGRHNDVHGPPIHAFIITVLSSRPRHLPDDLFVIYTYLLGDTIEHHDHTSPRVLFERNSGFWFLGMACIKDSIVAIGHGIGRGEKNACRATTSYHTWRALCTFARVHRSFCSGGTNSCKHANPALKRNLSLSLNLSHLSRSVCFCHSGRRCTWWRLQIGAWFAASGHPDVTWQWKSDGEKNAGTNNRAAQTVMRCKRTRAHAHGLVCTQKRGTQTPALQRRADTTVRKTGQARFTAQV